LTALGIDAGAGLVAVGDTGFVRLCVGADLQVTIAEVIAPLALPPGIRFNDGKVDGAGRFWAGTMDDAERIADGSLYRLDRGGNLSSIRTHIGVPNGPCFFADGTMLFADSAARRISTLDLDCVGNPISERMFAQFTPEQGYPDGMTVDDEDHVWIAFWGGWCLRRMSRSGRIVAEVRLPVERPTCPAFGGPDLDCLFVTTATTGLTAVQLQQQPYAGGLLALKPGIRGRHSYSFAG
jgi:sugar lactone lactonase YvrE